MSAEDALFRVMVPVAESLVAKQRRAGKAIDPAAVAEATLQAFAQSIALDVHAAPLRQRIIVYVANHRSRFDLLP